MYPVTQSHFEKENAFVFVSLLGKVEKLKIPTDISLKVFSIDSQYVLVINLSFSYINLFPLKLLYKNKGHYTRIYSC